MDFILGIRLQKKFSVLINGRILEAKKLCKTSLNILPPPKFQKTKTTPFRIMKSLNL